jgi:hypothetical protein
LLREPEVQNLRVARQCHQNVGRLEVAVDNPARVRRVERIGHLHGNRQRLGQWHGPARDPCRERLPLDEFHRDEMPAIAFADVVNRADIRMIERGGGASLATETLRRGGIDLLVRRQKLQRHRAAEPGVLGTVHHPHTAPAERGENPVVQDYLTNHSGSVTARFAMNCVGTER